MVMLERLKPAEGAHKSGKRVGRGPGSGWGKTAGRGMKGHRARSGGKGKRGFEGGQMPLQRRMPKFGFTNIFKKRYALVNLRDLARFEAGTVVDPELLLKEGIIKKPLDGVKVLGQGEISQPLTLRVHRFSSSVKAKIEAQGGKVEVL
jgi:large subunit ribosomal protein L15